MAAFEILTKDASGLYDYVYTGETFKGALKFMEIYGPKEAKCSVRLHGREIFTGTVYVVGTKVAFILEA